MRTRLALLIYTCAATAALAAPATTGAVKGSVVDDAGKPVPGTIRVFLNQALPPNAVVRPAPPVQTGPQLTARFADRDGNFRADTLAPGDYVACAATATPGYLDPCQWAAKTATFTVVAGQTVQGVKIVLAKGAIIPIRLNDTPQKMLKQQDGAVDGAVQIHLVTGGGHHHIARIVAQDNNGRDYSLTVPFGTPLNVQVFSSQLAISEPSGKLSAAGGFGIAAPASATLAPIVLNVTGAK